MALTIDLNSDLGESLDAWRMGDDATMLGIVSSVNVARGFHAGDPAGLLGTLRCARAGGVSVGAHVGYRDLLGFGRRALDVDSRELVADVIYQISALQGLAAAGTRVRYVKPHGALYNTIAHDERQARDMIAAIQSVDRGLALVALAGRFSGIYPQASPGGWQIIGATLLATWNLERDPPALLPPGFRVRFIGMAGLLPGQRAALERASQPGRAAFAYPKRADAAAGPALEILAPGLQTLLQDTGRHG